ncbi:MAG: hypothetical protein L0Y56_02975 [Nitrospira sp.]|nr:hypothetical protein [Nitrospira sp.]
MSKKGKALFTKVKHAVDDMIVRFLWTSSASERAELYWKLREVRSGLAEVGEKHPWTVQRGPDPLRLFDAIVCLRRRPRRRPWKQG